MPKDANKDHGYEAHKGFHGPDGPGSYIGGGGAFRALLEAFGAS